MRETWIPLFQDIRNSSIWAHDSDIRIVWFTLLTMVDPEGYVAAAIPGIAIAANVPVGKVREAIALFESPDPDSRSEANEGRRIQRVPRGWLILNFADMRRRASAEAEKARKRRWKQRQRDASPAPPADVSPGGSELVDASKSKSKSKSDPEGGDTRLPVFYTLEGWELSPELRQEALLQGVPDVEERVAAVRVIPIGGTTGTTDRDGWVRSQFPRWRRWRETDAAKGSMRRPEPEAPKRPRVPGVPEWVSPVHAELAEERGVDLKRAARAFAKGYHLPVASLRANDVLEPFRTFLLGLDARACA